MLDALMARFLFGSGLFVLLAIYWHFRPNKLPKVIKKSWAHRWSTVIHWLWAPVLVGIIASCVIFFAANIETNRRKDVQGSQAPKINLIHFNRIAAGLEPVGNYNGTQLARLALDLRPLLAQDTNAQDIPENISDFKVVSDKYLGVSNWFGFCVFNVTSTDNTCDDHGSLSRDMQINLLDALQSDASAIQVPAEAKYHIIDSKRYYIDFGLNSLAFGWIFSVLLFGLIDWNKGSDRLYMDILETKSLSESELSCRSACIIFNPYLLLALLFMKLQKLYDQTVLAKSFKLVSRNKTLSKVEFASELKEAYVLRDKLLSFEPTEEVIKARKFVAATIDTLQEVPKIKKRDEQRIQAVNMMKEAKRLLVPAETNLEAHKELMRAYHDEQIKEDLKELLPKNVKWDSTSQEWTK